MRLTRPFHAALLAACLLALPAMAGELLAIRAGRVLDVEGARFLHKQVILVDGERIGAIGAEGSLAIPAGARVIDLSTSTVLPGLIDAHTHLTGNPQLLGYNSLGESDIRMALYGVRAARDTLMAGFTTVRNVGSSGFADVALRDAIDAGDLPGPRIVAAGYALGMQGGHCDNTMLPADYKDISKGMADGPWAVRAKVREMVKYGADVIKICATGGVMSKGDSPGAQEYTLEEMQAIVQEAHKMGRRVAAHAHGTSGILDAIRAGVDSVEHASFIDAEGIRLAKEKGTWLVMDIYNDDYLLAEGEKAGMHASSLAKEKEVGQLQRDNFRKAHAGGAKMAFGSDAGIYPHGDNYKQFAYMVKYGMTPMAALQAATIHAADLLGLKDKIGSIKAGKFADLIAVPGDPLADVAAMGKVSFVMRSGAVVKQP